MSGTRNGFLVLAFACGMLSSSVLQGGRISRVRKWLANPGIDGHVEACFKEGLKLHQRESHDKLVGTEWYGFSRGNVNFTTGKRFWKATALEALRNPLAKRYGNAFSPMNADASANLLKKLAVKMYNFGTSGKALGWLFDALSFMIRNNADVKHFYSWEHNSDQIQMLVGLAMFAGPEAATFKEDAHPLQVALARVGEVAIEGLLDGKKILQDPHFIAAIHKTVFGGVNALGDLAFSRYGLKNFSKEIPFFDTSIQVPEIKEEQFETVDMTSPASQYTTIDVSGEPFQHMWAGYQYMLKEDLKDFSIELLMPIIAHYVYFRQMMPQATTYCMYNLTRWALKELSLMAYVPFATMAKEHIGLGKTSGLKVAKMFGLFVGLSAWLKTFGLDMPFDLPWRVKDYYLGEVDRLLNSFGSDFTFAYQVMDGASDYLCTLPGVEYEMEPKSLADVHANMKETEKCLARG